MKLNELKASDAKYLIKNTFSMPKEVQEYLINNGYIMIGEGAYSQVWALHGSNAVIKVSTKADKCWLLFAEYSKLHPNKHLPKISRLIKYKSKYNGAEFFIAFMERLEPISKAKWMTSSFDDIKGMIVFSYDKEKMKEYTKKNPDLAKIFDDLIQARIKTNCGFDIHRGNIMIRPSTGDIVITDPLA